MSTENENQKSKKKSVKFTGLLSFYLYLLMTASLFLFMTFGIGVKYLAEKNGLFQKRDILKVDLQLQFQKEAAQRIFDMYSEDKSFEDIDLFAERNGISYAIYSSYYQRRIGGTLAEKDEVKAHKYVVLQYFDVFIYLNPEKISWNRFSNAYKFIFLVIRYHKLVLIGCVGSLFLFLLCMVAHRIVIWKRYTGKKIVLPVEIVVISAVLLLYWGYQNVGYYEGFSVWKSGTATDILDEWLMFQYSIYFSPIIGFVLWYVSSFSGIKEMYRHSIFYFLKSYSKKLPLFVRLGILIALLLIAELLVLVRLLPFGYYTNTYVLWGIEKVIVIPFCVRIILALDTLENAAKKIADGELEYRVEVSSLPVGLKRFGQYMNEVAGGVSGAVDEKMKSERLKTELITNVSHDIKTPLTSIINFADLIGKEKTDNPKVEEYAGLLYHQSIRLKKLLEDLLEASKAATGNIEVHLEACDVKILLGQCLGEYTSKLNEQGLEFIMRQTEEPVWIMADPKLLWRIFDNLMSNICKYSQDNTRVYLTTVQEEKQLYITFKNISKHALDMETDELMERFVRGDLSRHTEGHGLGLSVVKSLMELQGGKVEIAVDGDLFKVTLTFPLAR